MDGEKNYTFIFINPLLKFLSIVHVGHKPQKYTKVFVTLSPTEIRYFHNPLQLGRYLEIANAHHYTEIAIITRPAARSCYLKHVYYYITNLEL